MPTSTTGNIRATAQAVTTSLVVPHGYTLSISGTLAGIVHYKGTPNILQISAFTLGGSVTFCALVLISGSYQTVNNDRRLAVPSVAMFNFSPVVITPISVGVAALVPRKEGAFFVGALAATCTYVLLISLMIALGLPARGPDPAPTQSQRANG
jgi:hypothetical protein